MYIEKSKKNFLTHQNDLFREISETADSNIPL